MIIEERLREEVNKIRILPDTQTGFKKNRSTMDNLYILNHTIRKEINKRGGKAFFVDLKAVFDIINREKRWIMKSKAINTHLIRKIGEIYEETISTVLIEGNFIQKICGQT